MSEPQPSETRRSRLRWELFAFLELCALSGLALTQPLLDATGRSPDFFLFHGAQARDVLLMVAVFTLTPPLVLCAVGAASGLAGRVVRHLVHHVLVGLLFAVLAVEVGKAALPVRGLPLAVLAALAAAGMTWLYRRFHVPRQILRVSSVGPLVFVAMFLFVSPASALVLPKQRPAAPVAGGQNGPHPPVVVVFLDEFPLVLLLDGRGEIDAARFPNFARLAQGSTWYRNATGVSSWTPYAMPAMLTGRYPAKAVAPHYSQYPQNLFTLLGSSYRIEAQESIARMCPPQLCDPGAGSPGSALPMLLKDSAGLLSDIVSPSDVKRDPSTTLREPTVADRSGTAPHPPDDTSIGPTFRWDRLSDNQPARFRDFLAGLRPSATPTLHFLHLLMPHAPWTYLPSGLRYDAPSDLPTEPGWWLQLAHQRHSLQVQYTDLLLGEALRALEESGLFDQSLVVVTADHGISFTPKAYGRGMAALEGSAGELMWVPLFIKEPNQRTGRVDDRNWEHVDLLPTIADHLGIEVPWQTDGISALRERRDRTDRYMYLSPGERVRVDGPTNFGLVRQGSTVLPRLPAPPYPELVGKPVASLHIRDGGPRATVDNAELFRDVRPDAGTVPALVYGDVPPQVPDGTLLAVAVNGTIGAVIPVMAPSAGAPRFAGMIADDNLFLAGVNRLELFEVTDGGANLVRLKL